MMRNWTNLLATALLAMGILAGCSRDESSISQSEWEKLIAIRGEAREICRLETLQEFEKRTQAANATQPELTQQLAARIGEITTSANLRLLQKIEDSYAPDSEDERKVRRLRHYLMQLELEQMTKEPREYLAEMRGAAKFGVNGRQVSYERLMEILSSSHDRDLRQEAFVAWIPELQKENAVIESKIALEDSAAVNFGYGDFTSLQQEKQQLDYARLSEQASNVLAHTDSLTQTLAATVVPQLAGLQADRLRGYDIAFLASTTPFDKYFAAETLYDRLGSVLSGMGTGFDPSWKASVHFSSNRNERPGTFAVSIPDDIRIVLPEGSGVWGAAMMAHELGHALHYRNTTEREFEFTQLGEVALKEAYAFTIESLLDEPEIASGVFGIPEKEMPDFLRQRAYLRLMSLRSYCAEFLFEQEVYAGAPNLRQVFEDIKEPVSGYVWNDVDRELLFRDLDGFAAAEYLTGWFLSAQIREHLRGKFGQQWYKSPEAGVFLKGMWQNGTRKSAQEIAAIVGDSAIAPDALLRELRSVASIQK